MAKLYTFQVNVVHPQMQLDELIVNVSFYQNKGKKKGGCQETKCAKPASLGFG